MVDRTGMALSLWRVQASGQHDTYMKSKCGKYSSRETPTAGDSGTRRGNATLVMMRLPREQSWTGRERGSEQGLKGRNQGPLKNWRTFRELEEQVGKGVGLGETEEVRRVMGALQERLGVWMF